MFDIVDSKADLLDNLGLDKQYQSDSLELLEQGNSRWLKDLRVNLKNVLESEHLDEKETALLALSIAVNDKNQVLKAQFVERAQEKGATAEEIAETTACASLLASNNITYRFRHYLGKEKYEQSPMRIKMNIMMKPVLGKEFFELISLAVSAVNGCEMCVKAHEQSLLEMESTEARIWDAVRLAGVVTSLNKIVF